MSPVTVRPFSDERNLLFLRDFFLSCLGPRGGLKMFQSSAGHMTVTNTSERLLRCLELDSAPCAEAVLIGVKSFLERHGDGGLTLASLATGLTGILRGYTPTVASALAKGFARLVESVMQEQQIKVDLANLGHLMSVVESVLGSKSWAAGKAFRARLGLKVVEAFLRSLPEPAEQGGDGNRAAQRRFSAGANIHVRVVQGVSDSCELLDGFLYHMPELDVDETWWWTRFSPGQTHTGQSVNVLALNMQLLPDMAELAELASEGLTQTDYSCTRGIERMIMRWMERLCKLCQARSVSVVINQKCVLPEAIQLFRRQHVLLLERLGRDSLRQFVDLSGAKVISSLHSLDGTGADEVIGQSMGQIDDVLHEARCGKSFLRFRRRSAECTTLLVEHWNEQAGEEIKVLCQRSLSNLFSLLSHPYVAPGAGCLQARIAFKLIQQSQSFADCQLVQPGDWRSFSLQVARLLSLQAISIRRAFVSEHESAESSFGLDKTFGHLWYLPDIAFGQEQANDEGNPASCSCGFVMKSRNTDLRWWPLPLHCQEQKQQLQQLKQLPPIWPEHVIVDNYFLKGRTFQTALELSEGLAAVGLVVIKQ